ncbi:MAG TPA: GDP-L-fucose synthase [Azonexus sp.]|nr:GDP-L-fucose synthase [Azonexus sp.]
MNASYSLRGKRVWVTGHRGMVGSAIVRRLQREECTILTASRDEVDLTRQAETEAWLEANRPEVVFVAAAKVGGIHANSVYPVDFLHDNLAIELNVIHGSWKIGVEKLVFLGSSCIYPRMAPQPIPEDALLTGPLEPTNEWYAIAKIAGIKMCQAYRRQYGANFISVMPTNLYGPGDNFHPENSHVPAALMRRFHEAKLAGDKESVVWGSGQPRREFLHVDDMADACVFLTKTCSCESHINVGTGSDVSIAEFAEAIRRVVGYEGKLVFDTSKPDGMPRKMMDVSLINRLGWSASIPLEEGLRDYYHWFLDNIYAIRT